MPVRINGHVADMPQLGLKLIGIPRLDKCPIRGKALNAVVGGDIGVSSRLPQGEFRVGHIDVALGAHRHHTGEGEFAVAIPRDAAPFTEEFAFIGESAYPWYDMSAWRLVRTQQAQLPASSQGLSCCADATWQSAGSAGHAAALPEACGSAADGG